VSAILAEDVDVVIGVDAHTDTHSAAVVSHVGMALAQVTVVASAAGAGDLLVWVEGQAPGLRRAWVVDGTRSHGLGLTRYLKAAGERVIEAPKGKGTSRRRGGKSDVLDAVHVARAVLAAEHVATPRADGDREALRLLHVCRRHYSDARTATVNLLKSLVLTADDDLRAQVRTLNTDQQVKRLQALAPPPGADTLTRTRYERLAALAVEIAALDKKLTDNLSELRTLVATMCPALLEQPGVGPVGAAVALTAWSHKGRLRGEAAFAALAGVNPIPASSGRIVRHRLNRGGDRTLNCAIHTMAMHRRRCHQPTRDYVERRTKEGRTAKEINRCLKRYIARQLFRLMEATP
jgi:transposase